VKGPEFRKIREELGLTRNEFAIELGYRGNERNNSTLIERYEHDRKQIPLTVASLAWLIREYVDLVGTATGNEGIELPDWPEWEGYELEKDVDRMEGIGKELQTFIKGYEEGLDEQPDDDPAGGPPASNESSSS